jgi:hypothetical protein
MTSPLRTGVRPQTDLTETFKMWIWDAALPRLNDLWDSTLVTSFREKRLE